MHVRGRCWQIFQPLSNASGRNLTFGSNLHLELLPLFQGGGEGGEQLGNLLQIFQVDYFHRRVHVAIWQTYQRAGDSPARPENRVSIGAARPGHGFVL